MARTRRPPTSLGAARALEANWNVMAHAQKPDVAFRRNGRVHLNRRGRQFSRLLAAEVCASAVVMLDTPCSEVVRRVLVTHSIRQFPLHFLSLRHRVPSHFSWSLRAKRIVRSAVEHLCNSPPAHIVGSQQAVVPCVANRKRWLRSLLQSAVLLPYVWLNLFWSKLPLNGAASEAETPVLSYSLM